MYFYIFTEFLEIQKLTKQSLDIKWRKFFSHDWIPRGKDRGWSPRKFYVELIWVKKIPGILEKSKEEMTSLEEILEATPNDDKARNVIIEGKMFCAQENLQIGRLHETFSIMMNVLIFCSNSWNGEDFHSGEGGSTVC